MICRLAEAKLPSEVFLTTRKFTLEKYTPSTSLEIKMTGKSNNAGVPIILFVYSVGYFRPWLTAMVIYGSDRIYEKVEILDQHIY